MNVYDFDNTIYDGESVVDFFFFCLRKRPSLIKLLPLMIIKLIKYKRCKISNEELEFYVKKYAFAIIDKLGNIDSLVCEFWEKNIYKVKSYYNKQRKSDDLILSATAGFILKEFSKRMGGINYICSEINLNTGKIERLCFRSKKVQIFKEQFPEVEIENFYTDSMNDKPMIEIAKNAYLVKGDKIKKIK